MRSSQFFMPTLRENPSEAQIVSHRLMLRAGMIRQQSAGIYTWLPLGLGAATFALMSAFPLILLGAYDTVAGHVVGAIGWGFLIWGIWMYLWSFAVYLVSVVQIVRQLPRVY